MNIKDKFKNILVPFAKLAVWTIDQFTARPLVASLSSVAIVTLLGGGIFFLTKDDDPKGLQTASTAVSDSKASYSLEPPAGGATGSKMAENIGGNVTAKETDIVIGGETPTQSDKDGIKYRNFMNHLENIDYKKIAEEASAKGNTLEPNDRELRKWIIRLEMISKIQNEKISDSELISTAKTAKERRTHFFNFVKHAYEINPTAEEVTVFIDKKAPNSPEAIKVAEGLKMSVKDMNYDYDADQYKQQLVWEKLLPVLKEKTPQNKNEKEDEYLSRIDSIFNEALDAYIEAL